MMILSRLEVVNEGNVLVLWLTDSQARLFVIRFRAAF